MTNTNGSAGWTNYQDSSETGWIGKACKFDQPVKQDPFYYQLVYDPNGMKTTVQHSDGTTTTGPYNPNSPQYMPDVLWDTATLQKYFENSTITNMRQYYCLAAFTQDPTARTLNKKCLGYLSAKVGNYTMLPMTVRY